MFLTEFYVTRAFGGLICSEKVREVDEVDPALDAREKALVWKQDLRIVPLCAGIYLLCYLDRSNIGVSRKIPQ